MIRFLDLSCSEDEAAEYCKAIRAVLRSGQFLNSPEVEQFEKDIRGYTGSRHALGVGSGTSAIYLALKALNIGPGDEVITSVLAFPGTANAIASVGATPVFADVGEDMLIDPMAVGSAVTHRTSAVMPVHFTGAMCNMDALLSVCRDRNLLLIEDAAPAFGATYYGQAAGTFGTLGCVSCNTMKPLAAVGEAGIVLCQDSDIWPDLLYLRYHGMMGKDTCVERSMNHRLDAIQAAVLSIRLKSLYGRQKKRTCLANLYSAALGDLVRVPTVPDHVHPAWYHYTIRCDERDYLADHLLKQGIETRIYHPKIMVQHPAYRNRVKPFPVAAKAAQEILCLPLHDKMTDSDVDKVVSGVRSFYGKAAAAA